MDKKLIYLQLGALLHDIGKIVRRAGVDNENHSLAGINFLKSNSLLADDYQDVYDIVNYHHAKELKSANLPNDSLAYIVYEADNIASGIDRVRYETNDKMLGNEMLPLNSIFNRLREKQNGSEGKNKVFSLKNFKADSFNMPKEKKENEKLESIDYSKVLNNIKENLKSMNKNINPEKLITVLEETCSYFPSSAYVDYPDISYYDHVKLTATISSCLYLYDKENKIENYKEEYFGNKNLRNKEKFLFVSGEFSGIQNFIYTITSKMAMKSLRGRSFYLELFIEHIIDEILTNLELSRVNLIYSGGSQFYLLLPNIAKASEILEKYKEIINNFLLNEVGTEIYFEMSYSPTTAEELGNGLSEEIKKENKVGEIFRKNSILTSKAKLNRYSETQLSKLFDENSEVNHIHSNTKECKICKKAESEQNLERNAKENAGNIELCNACNSYIKLGTDISKLYHKPDDMFILEKNCDKNLNKLIFPKFPVGYVEIEFKRKKELETKLKKGEEIHRFYAINSIYYGEGLPKNIRVGNYNIKVEKEENEYKLVEFKDLVKKSKGIERLAVLRADVDDLGSLFQSGFVNKKAEEPYKFITLSKSVVLSRYLSDFFKRKINLILEKKNATNNKNEIFKEYCDVINPNNEEARNIVIVYSGGDDVFAIGTWNDIIEFSVDLRNAFKEFTNGKITLSAGIGFFSENFPVYQMAEKTGDLEKKAKYYCKNGAKIPTKDAVALFGEETNNDLNHVYSWDEFISEVLFEKYSYLKSKVTFDENENSDKIFVGKSKWYKIMDLIRGLFDDTKTDADTRLDIARFAYILARIKNTEKNEKNYLEFREKVFKWIKDGKKSKDAKQLLTAINIIIYEEREKNQKEF